MKKTAKKKGIRKLEKTIEVRTAMLITLMEYVELKKIEDKENTDEITFYLNKLREDLEKQKIKHLENRIVAKLYMREYRKNNAEKIKKANTEYQEKHPEKMKEIGKRYREKKKMERMGAK